MNKISVAVTRDTQTKANLSSKVVHTRIEDGKILTIVVDMKEKVFEQISGLDALLVTPCKACETCRSKTDHMTEQDLLE